MEINEKYVRQTFEALSNNQLTTQIVAHQISKLPFSTQVHFFKLVIEYIEVLSEYAKNGYSPIGLEYIVKACREIMEVVDEHFPKPDVDEVIHGLEFVQL